MKITKQRIKEIIEEEIIIVMTERIVSKVDTKQLLNEELTKQDYQEIKDLIRAELAAVFFDFYKKRAIWV